MRQGNRNAEVSIYRYVTQGSFDAYMWQCLETKARFVAQVMSGQTSVRSAEDLASGALTYAEIKAIASGNPAVIEKVKVDTEVRKLDQLRAVHHNQQYKISWQLRELPARIAQAQRTADDVATDIVTRESHSFEEFTMTVGSRVFTGKGAREEAATALNALIISCAFDATMQVRATFRGFRILSQATQISDDMPTLCIEGARRYTANLNTANPIGTIQSIEHVLRNLDQVSAAAQREVATLTKSLADYREQANRPFEHESRLTELLTRQAELNAALDLEKGDHQAAAVAPADEAAA